MKRIVVVIIVLISWGFVKGQDVPEYRIDSIVIDKKCKDYVEEEDKVVRYNFHLALPRIVSTDEQYFEFINDIIKTQYLDRFKNPCKELAETKITFNVFYNNKKFLSLCIDEWGSFSPWGGNGSGGETKAYSIDLKNKKILKLKDIIKKESLGQFMKYAVDKLMQQFQDDIKIRDGIEYLYEQRTDEIIKQFKSEIIFNNINISKDKLLVYSGSFDESSVSDFPLSLKEIKKWCNEDVLKLLE